MLTMSPTIGKISAALAAAQGEMENPTKDSKNPYYSSMYADLASCYNAIRGPLAAHALAVTQHPFFTVGASNIEGTLTLTTLLSHESGEWIQSDISCPVVEVGKDGSLKPLNAQSIGKATTYCRRYSIAAIAGIAQEDDDGETAVRPVQPRAVERAALNPNQEGVTKFTEEAGDRGWTIEAQSRFAELKGTLIYQIFKDAGKMADYQKLAEKWAKGKNSDTAEAVLGGMEKVLLKAQKAAASAKP